MAKSTGLIFHYLTSLAFSLTGTFWHAAVHTMQTYQHPTFVFMAHSKSVDLVVECDGFLPLYTFHSGYFDCSIHCSMFKITATFSAIFNPLHSSTYESINVLEEPLGHS